MLDINAEAFEKAITKAVMREIPLEVGQTAVRFYKKNFERQGFVDNGVKRWKPTKRAKTKPILTGEKGGGKLRRSIRLESYSAERIVITAGNQFVPYAKIHNEGGIINESVQVRSHVRKKHYRRRKGRRQLVEQYTVKAHKRHMNIRIPKRQYMGQSETLNRHIDIITKRAINKAFQTLF
ncbi:phage virion morphogenesis family protein [Elysia marginata]|uniref:Phage virion morphogenesis family protein n=1 Tax=Elysia marginata TaxID=1093978 RepID=A0AAV4GXZ7_9GAST|nr:phage virion morphogenesis family protein [Elysia marginata]